MGAHHRTRHKDRNHRRHQPPQQPGAKAPQEPSSSKHAASRRGEIIFEVIVGLLCISLLVLAKEEVARKYWPLNPLTTTGYGIIQNRLYTRSFPVAIVNISDITPSAQAASNGATPREPLLQLITRLKEEGARAVGIDVDFSPDYDHSPTGYITAGDPAFFMQCLAFGQQFPVVLGVYRTAAQGPKEWLGNQKFSALAGDIAVPSDGVWSLYGWSNRDTDTGLCPPMSWKLAKSIDPAIGRDPPSWPARLEQVFIGTTRPEQLDKWSLRRFPVDYSMLGTLLNQKRDLQENKEPDPSVQRVYSYSEVMQAKSLNLAGKVVIIGDVNRVDSNDIFPIQGLEEVPPGVFLHACAVATLITPLKQFTPFGEVVVDAALGLILLSFFIWLDSALDNHPRGRRFQTAMQVAGVCAVILAVILFNVYLVSRTRLLWEDFLVCALVLVYHYKVQHHLRQLCDPIWRLFDKDARHLNLSKIA